MPEHGIFGTAAAGDIRSASAIPRAETGITAFVGRTLKGPVNEPIAIASFAEFERHFGGLWQPSTLSYAIEQYFDNGGRKALVVRVANGARPPTLNLPAGGGELRLVGVNPGSREYLRASVDYDGIGAGETDRFNLVLQRVRMPGTEHIEDQEIERRVSVDPGAARFVADVLVHSRLARVAGAVPRARPESTQLASGVPAVRYASSNPDGDDGAQLTDYDVIGSASAATGLLALQGHGGFDLLCIPPLGREQDVGLSTLLVAARFCRQHHAMLVVDPPAAWSSAHTALAALRTWPFRSDNAVMYFPRILAFDRLRRRIETFGSAGAAAGMLARADESLPVWAPAEGEEAVLRPGLKPALSVDTRDRGRLAQAGINTLCTTRSGGMERLSATTLGGASWGSADWRHLAARRLALFAVSSIEQGSRWLLTAPSTPPTWERARRQVADFLGELDRAGAFAGGRAEESYFVICDERVNRPESVGDGKINLLFGIATARPATFHTWMITYHGGASRVRSVAVNRLATSQERVEWEIETAILAPTVGLAQLTGVP
ncbi:MAG TPA: hypothetical protein VMU67_12380 [Steroidobacteraceae bacterium]|nr:hypothetical protein [Steroidobacteraceae bacterium]